MNSRIDDPGVSPSKSDDIRFGSVYSRDGGIAGGESESSGSDTRPNPVSTLKFEGKRGDTGKWRSSLEGAGTGNQWGRSAGPSTAKVGDGVIGIDGGHVRVNHLANRGDGGEGYRNENLEGSACGGSSEIGPGDFDSVIADDCFSRRRRGSRRTVIGGGARSRNEDATRLGGSCAMGRKALNSFIGGIEVVRGNVTKENGKLAHSSGFCAS